LAWLLLPAWPLVVVLMACMWNCKRISQ